MSRPYGQSKSKQIQRTRPKAHEPLSLDTEAMETLTWLMRNGESEQIRHAAANAILDRTRGRPRQAMELTGKDGGPLATTIAEEMSPAEAMKNYAATLDERKH